MGDTDLETVFLKRLDGIVKAFERMAVANEKQAEAAQASTRSANAHREAALENLKLEKKRLEAMIDQEREEHLKRQATSDAEFEMAKTNTAMCQKQVEVLEIQLVHLKARLAAMGG